MREFNLPDIGEGLHEAEIIRWFVAKGDYVQEHEALVELSTDKATVEITAPFSGTVQTLGGEEGDTILVGSLLCMYSEETAEKTTAPLIETAALASPIRIMAAPSVRKAAREANIDITAIQGSGPKGRVLLEDLTVSTKIPVEIAPVAPVALPSQEIPIRGVRKMIFENMMKATSKAVLCTGMSKFQASALVKMKKEVAQLPEFKDLELTYLPMIIKATAAALEKHPIMNAVVDEEKMVILLQQAIHIGVAMDTKDGLVVPVIREANTKSLLEITKDLQNLIEKVNSKTIAVSELTGSTFTVSSTGKSGGLFATPIVNYPEVAILGVHSIIKEPVVVDDQLQIGHTMTISCTFDHRIIDGGPAGGFMQEMANLLEEPMRLLL